MSPVVAARLPTRARARRDAVARGHVHRALADDRRRHRPVGQRDRPRPLRRPCRTNSSANTAAGESTVAAAGDGGRTASDRATTMVAPSPPGALRAPAAGRDSCRSRGVPLPPRSGWDLFHSPIRAGCVSESETIPAQKVQPAPSAAALAARIDATIPPGRATSRRDPPRPHAPDRAPLAAGLSAPAFARRSPGADAPPVRARRIAAPSEAVRALGLALVLAAVRRHVPSGSPPCARRPNRTTAPVRHVRRSVDRARRPARAANASGLRARATLRRRSVVRRRRWRPPPPLPPSSDARSRRHRAWSRACSKIGRRSGPARTTRRGDRSGRRVLLAHP